MSLRHLRQILSAALCVLAGAAAAKAQQTAGTLNAFGLFGSWAVQCGAPPSAANVVQTIAWTGREPVEYSATIGPPAPATHYRVISAQMSNATTLVMEVVLNGRDTENLTIAKSGNDAIRTMWNRSARGFVVQNGVVDATGRPTPWLRKCR